MASVITEISNRRNMTSWNQNATFEDNPSNLSEQICTLFSIYGVSFLLKLTFVDWHLPLRLVCYAQEGSKKYGPQTCVKINPISFKLSRKIKSSSFFVCISITKPLHPGSHILPEACLCSFFLFFLSKQKVLNKNLKKDDWGFASDWREHFQLPGAAGEKYRWEILLPCNSS